jgi:decaprenyl-phosphate phosphoribosyltransferase
MQAIIRLIRVKQWVKNLFLFIPTFFAGNLFDIPQLKLLLLGVLAFSLAASGVYVINDYQDRELDRIHTRKKTRPIASGEVKEVTAWILMITLAGGGLLLAYYIEHSFFYLLLGYLILNVAYSMGLKNVPILDLFIVASGFLVRIYCGGIIAHVPITHWLSIMIMLLALFIVLAKRRDDLLIQSETGEIVRKASRSYNLEFINSCLTLLSAVVIVAYIMYTVSPEVTQHFRSEYLFSTTVFVIAGIMRYLQITFVEQDSGSPTSILFKDKFLLITVAGWIVSFYIIIYAS